jgi:hypothetical protein|tara:strand:+ start:1704 stop:2351 length:648 start_codon:yes stop_codon:yes gene_type:complete
MAVATSLAIGAAVGGITKMVGAQMQKNAAKEDKLKQEKIANDSKLALEELEKNRQEVINPYENMANEFENIGVATQASKFQAEEADMSLANTLDTIMQTGGGAGGATALARAALESKRGISADIQKQEQTNNTARAEGANQVQQLKAQGEAYKFETQEARDVTKMNRLQVEQDNATMLARQAEQTKQAANQQMLGALGGIGQDLAGGLTGSIGKV